ncbi:hypothetical protein NDNC_0920 [Candidatus Nasuia deltocephalinicola]|uniref:Small ribosomal subunit protein bS6 n=1 Tax=Candidatus Nasuia deltocephalincola TaxID=1160784 RepID=A0A974WKE1_9PROT|nr:hypothetical protein CU086_00180 [Candidatus Nasuia deltocephalinicola]WKD87140.1 30S ribosomal protein S6 [Candidatus Nasuia deltocephalinicola]BEH03926.1 hypothetical protein NDNC_0920 [Candidatus Nasuia deltocephalinicola]
MKIYEIVIIFNHNYIIFIDNFIKFFKNYLIYNNFIILKLEKWGLLNFKYVINNNKKGYFVALYFRMNSLYFLKFLKYVKSFSYIVRIFYSVIKKYKNFINKLCFNRIIKKNEKIIKNFK